ncbi:MAG: 16S rRNA (uracil(1498)-N(3))-methyltransferase [Vicinamibacterales bacterium]
MVARVFAPEAIGPGQALDVPDDEARWLRDVLRLDAGARLRVFDGRGHEWEATITTSRRQGVVAALGEPAPSAPEPRIAYTAALAVLKGDATDEAVRDAVMMGALAIRPFVCARAEQRLATVARANRRHRWQRVAIASAKQCGRAVVPEVHDAVAFETLLAVEAHGLRLLLVEPAVGADTERLDAVAPPAAVTIGVGPEGGWTPAEVQAASAAGWRSVSLGGRVLRAAAVPLAALAACQAVWRDS